MSRIEETDSGEFIFLMHDTHGLDGREENWQPYLDMLIAAGALRGGSAMGSGLCVRRSGDAPAISHHLVGYMKIEARDLNHAQELIPGNPVYEAGGTVEIRELPVTS